MQSELLLQAATENIIGSFHGSIRIHPHFRHHEKRNPFDALRRTVYAGNDQMNDIFRQIVIPPGDENYEHLLGPRADM